MKCPACSGMLNPITVNNVTVDICNDCGGSWFDVFELKKLIYAVDFKEEIMKIGKKGQVEIDNNSVRKCPKCNDVIMMNHFSSVKKQVRIDECPACGGVWLDAEELVKMRNEFSSEEEKIKATKEFVNKMFKTL